MVSRAQEVRIVPPRRASLGAKTRSHAARVTLRAAEEQEAPSAITVKGAARQERLALMLRTGGSPTARIGLHVAAAGRVSAYLSLRRRAPASWAWVMAKFLQTRTLLTLGRQLRAEAAEPDEGPVARPRGCRCAKRRAARKSGCRAPTRLTQERGASAKEARPARRAIGRPRIRVPTQDDTMARRATGKSAIEVRVVVWRRADSHSACAQQREASAGRPVSPAP